MSEAEIRPRRSGAAAPDLLVSSYSSGMPASPEGGGEGRRKLGKPAPPPKWGAAETAETVVLRTTVAWPSPSRRPATAMAAAAWS